MIAEIFKVLCFILFLCSVSIYLVIRPPVDENAKWPPERQKKFSRVFFSAIALMILFGFSPFFKDLWYYYKFGNAYLREKTCVVKRTYHLPIFFFVKREIRCEGEQYTYRRHLTFDDYEPGEVIRFSYFPESRTILRYDVANERSRK